MNHEGKVPKVYVSRIEGRLSAEMDAALEWIGWQDIVFPQCRVFIKPNLTWPLPTPGVTTTPYFLEALVSAVRSRTDHVTIGESDGGYHSFGAEEAFRRHGIYEIAQRYDAKVVNLSDLASEYGNITVDSEEISVELPSLLLHEMDVFITVPVPKVHAMTRVSLAFKNQWGCIPSTMRLRNHAKFDQKIVAINKLVQPKIAVYDGSYFLDKNGPMLGEPVLMDLIIAADDIGAGDAVCCRLMAIESSRVKHLTVARRAGLFPNSVDELALNRPLGEFKSRQFRLERSLVNWIALAAFNNSLTTRFLYDSVFADPIHQVLHCIRRNALIARLLYSEVGVHDPKREAETTALD